MQTEVNLPFVTADQSGPKHLNIKLTRAKLEALVEDLVTRTVEPCKAALKDAGLSAGEVDEVIMVGGMTRMPKIIETVQISLERSHIEVLIQMKLWQWVLESRRVCCKVM